MDDIRDDLRKLFGLPPHDRWGNTSAGDGYFFRSIERKYGKPIAQLLKETGVDKEMVEQKRRKALEGRGY